MTLSKRLDALRQQAGAAPQPQTPEAGNGDLRAQLERLDRHRRQARARPVRKSISAEALAESLGGKVVADHLMLVERHWPLTERHGDQPLSLANESTHPVCEIPAKTLYLDTETTGLAGGTGTLAFMVGVADQTATHIRTRQWLITAFAGEAAMLHATAEALRDAEAVVTYNGSGFDLPLLRSRHRLIAGTDLPEADHTDLLHPVRRLFRDHWPDCRLATVERQLLGLQRMNDLPGAEAPEAWKAFLAGDPNHRLAGVLHHNALDILSLTVLPAMLCRAAQKPKAHGAVPRAAARLWTKHGNVKKAIRILEQSLEQLDMRGRHELARLLRNTGRSEEAVIIWQAMAEQGNQQATEHLAKYYEHVQRDYAVALDHAERLGADAYTRKRVERLQRRLLKPVQLALAL
ncbi:ribonuclease H-like domain-containing protein [Methylonatrum kenyense]|uniref:ribonuclease H-like domain-containing protein n=1 Tax=Methylonatrum kenyense TaxID=455253 RepID=UPI0020BDFA70|nr:ribonuclease H-like domain-containing protein [Methylonatrum kenyense]MCK8514719.1 ribonuclease H-like domain-containing protein [Methylonatrum kenyense]